MAVALFEPQGDKSNDDCQPIHVIRDDRAISGAVLPTCVHMSGRDYVLST